jgi:CRP-like cAMP-binding protein
MEKYFDILLKCSLFKGIERSELNSMLACMDYKTIEVLKGSPVFLEGDPVQFVGVVLSGAVQVIREDYYGNRSVLTILNPGELFAEVFSCAGLDTMPVSVIAQKDSELLLLDCRRVLSGDPGICHFHSLLVNNLLKELAQKNLALNQKIQYMSQKKTKEKLLAFLLEQAKQHGSSEFVIPYDRQALADYLGVERSAMAAEIGKMKKSGQIDTRGSWFCLKQVQG